ncbi:MAG TPA: hypothetical protein VGG39_29845 [Polyangiaceae bacterium]|jgi:hypothetical protein
MAQPAGGFTIATRVVKGLGIAVGGACSFVAFASLVGIVTGNAWARALIALVLCVVFPAFAVDRALPKGDATKGRAGLVVDVVALVLLGIAMLFIGIGQPVTRPLLVKEGDRLAEDDHAIAAHVVYLMAGVRPVDAPPPASPPAPGASAATPGAPVPSASAPPPASAAPSPSPSASSSGAP